jgi:hypothetical protein
MPAPARVVGFDRDRTVQAPGGVIPGGGILLVRVVTCPRPNARSMRTSLARSFSGGQALARKGFVVLSFHYASQVVSGQRPPGVLKEGRATPTPSRFPMRYEVCGRYPAWMQVRALEVWEARRETATGPPPSLEGAP